MIDRGDFVKFNSYAHTIEMDEADRAILNTIGVSRSGSSGALGWFIIFGTDFRRFVDPDKYLDVVDKKDYPTLLDEMLYNNFKVGQVDPNWVLTEDVLSLWQDFHNRTDMPEYMKDWTPWVPPWRTPE